MAPVIPDLCNRWDVNFTLRGTNRSITGYRLGGPRSLSDVQMKTKALTSADNRTRVVPRVAVVPELALFNRVSGRPTPFVLS
jgi:hypothetical protein